jgi:hypothetical protein
VNLHVLGEAPRAAAVVDRQIGDAARRQGDRLAGADILELGRGDLCRDALRCHVGCADDLLLIELVRDGALPVETEHNCGDAESDKDNACDDSADFEEPLHEISLLRPWRLDIGAIVVASRRTGSRARHEPACGFSALARSRRSSVALCVRWRS